MISSAVKIAIVNRNTPWCNGNTAPFGGVIHGSNPCGVANLIAVSVVRFQMRVAADGYGLGLVDGEGAGVEVGETEVVGIGNANVAEGDADGVVDVPGEGDGVDVGVEVGVGLGVGVGMVFSQ